MEIEQQLLELGQHEDSLQASWKIMRAVKANRGTADAILLGAAFRYGLVEYSKPFRNSRGTWKDSKGRPISFKLDDRFTPGDQAELHDRILSDRDQIHAHSDLSPLDPGVYAAESCGVRFVGRSQNIVHGTELLTEIDSIIRLIECTLDNLKAELARLKSQYPVRAG